MAGSFVTNAGNLAARKRVLAGEVEEKFRHIAKLQGEVMRQEAVKLSSGGLSTQQLRAMGHPYARRFPAGSAGQPDYIINTQTGGFRDSWVMRVTKTAKGWTITLYNTTPYGRYMRGTELMRRRAILEEVLRRSIPYLSVQVRKVVRQAAQGNSAIGGVGTVANPFLIAVLAGASSVAGALEGAL